MTSTVDHLAWPELENARVLVVDDDAYAVRSLGDVLAEAGAVVKTAMSVRSALEALSREDRFDAAVVDFFLVGQTGNALLRPLRDQLTCTLMISGVEREDVANQAISSGADDFMLKPFDVDEFLVSVARLVERTRSWREKLSRIRLGVRPERKGRSKNPFDEQIGQIVASLSQHAGLSERETKVVRLVVDSLTNDQIAGRLGISVSTVKHHDGKARTKLGVESRDELRQLVLKMVRSRRPIDE